MNLRPLGHRRPEEVHCYGSADTRGIGLTKTFLADRLRTAIPDGPTAANAPKGMPSTLAAIFRNVDGIDFGAKLDG